MLLESLLNFILEQTPDLLLTNLFRLLGSNLKQLLFDTKADDLDDDDGNSEMGDKIWFDGVSKRLIEAHSKKVEEVKVDDTSLQTNRPLISYRGIVKRRKQLAAQKHINNKTSDTESINGHASTSTNGTNKSSKRTQATNGTATTSLDTSKYMLEPSPMLTEELALDCEMVECFGHKSVLARISIVNLFGRVMLDTFVAPPSQVTDYRTRYSGVRAADLANAPSFETVQARVAKIIKDRIVVGHAVHNDFNVLKLQHPTDKTRDTSPFFGKHYGLGKTPSLKRLCQQILGIKIQSGEHDSVVDAQATMKLYVKVREKWNESVLKGKLANKQAHKTKKQQKSKKPQKKKVKAFFVESL